MRVAILIVLVLCGGTAPASASVVSAATSVYYPDRGDPYDVQHVSVIAGAAETNAVVIDRSGPVTIVRDGAGATAGAGCEAQTATAVHCFGPALESATVTLGDGDDRLVFATPFVGGGARALVADGGDGDDRLVAGLGNAVLNGGDGDDLLVGGAAWDTLDGGRGTDELIGGAGVDTAVYANRSEPLHLDRDGDADDGAAGEVDRIEADVEQLVGGDGDDVLLGTDRGDDLDGGGGDDTLVGLAGRDTLEGHGGDDRFDGGAARDVIYGGRGADIVVAGTGNDHVDADFESDAEPSRAGEPDSIAGGPGADTLMGGARLDAIDPGAGADTVDGGPGGATVRAVDGASDLVTCSRDARAGTGSVDAADLVRGCAAVDRTGVARPRLLLLGQSDLDADGVLRVGIGCSQDMRRACRGRLRISRRGRTLARMPILIRRGTARLFRPRVPRRLATTRGSRCPHSRVRLTLTLRDAGGRPLTIRRRHTVISSALFCNARTLVDSFTTGWD